MSSLVSAKGPSVTLALPLRRLTRAPLALDCRPPPSSMTPAAISSLLYAPIAAISSGLGRAPASDSSLALTITITRIAISPLQFRPTHRLAVHPRTIRLAARRQNAESLACEACAGERSSAPSAAMTMAPRLKSRLRAVQWDPLYWVRVSLLTLGRALTRLWGR